MATVLGAIGEEVTLLVRQGATLSHNVLIRDALNAPVDMTGSQVRGQIRKTPFDTAVVAAFTIDIVNSAEVSFRFSLSDAVTAAFIAGASIDDAHSQYVWDLEWQDSAGTVRPLFYGTVKVHREVTRV